MVNVLRDACPGGLTDLFIILGIEAFAFAFDFPTQSLSTLSALCVAFVGLLVLFRVCKPFDWRRRALWGGVAAAMLFCITCLGEFFSLTPLSLQERLVLAVFLALSWTVMRAVLAAFERGRRLFLLLKGKRKARARK